MQEEAYAPRDMISMYSRVGDEALRGTSPRLKKYVWRPNRSTGRIPVARFNSICLEMFPDRSRDPLSPYGVWKQLLVSALNSSFDPSQLLEDIIDHRNDCVRLTPGWGFVAMGKTISEYPIKTSKQIAHRLTLRLV